MNKDGDGGPSDQRDVMNYKPPQGPKGIMDPAGPGLHGHNCGSGGVQGPASSQGNGSSGSPGLGGTNHGSAGTQGRR